MPRMDRDDVGTAQDFIRALRDPSSGLRARYQDDPVGLAERLGLKLPRKPIEVMAQYGEYEPEIHGPILPGLRDLVQDVCTGLEESAAVVGPRGGGKSQGVSFIEFFLVFVRDFDALNLGGSELQADQVYQYLLAYIESEEEWKSMLKGDTLQSKTTTKNDAWIRVLTASQKSVRSPHAGGRKKNGRLAGGLLVIDEEAEADADIVSAALPTINTAIPSVNVRCSTFHNISGSFADLIDNHSTMGYKYYHWDIFDVCEGCDCTDECESDEKCFREDHFEMFTDPSTGEMVERLVHRAYCGGRAKYADGWIPMNEIEKLWKRMKRNHSKWEVEAMGSRPTTKGHVIKDHTAVARNAVDKTGSELYIPGMPITICVDWGVVAAGITVWQEQMGDQHALIDAELIEEAGQTQIFGAILSRATLYQNDLSEIAADIGGGGNYLNPKLREEHSLPVRDVNFNEDKEAAVAAWNILNEAGLCTYPSEFEDFHIQVKKWQRKNGRIQKGNDHLMDSSVCYFAKFIDRLGVKRLRVVARTASTGASDSGGNGGVRHSRNTGRTMRPRPMVRTIGGRRRR